MARQRVILNSAGVRALLSDPGVAADLERRGQAVLAAARAVAPVRTGAYRDSLHVTVAQTDRVVVRVVAGVDYGDMVEASAGALSRALDAAGGG